MIKEVEMCKLQGKNIKVVCNDDKEFIGYCDIFTQALDNEPEIASISINIPNRSGYTEIFQNEIKSIDILD